VFQTDCLEKRVQSAVLRIVQIQKDHGDSGLRDNIRNHVGYADKFPAMGLFVQNKCQNGAKRHMEDAVNGDPNHCVLQYRQKFGILCKKFYKVTETDELKGPW